MLPENKQNEKDFDNMLIGALKSHNEHVSDEFAENLPAKAQRIERQKIFRKIGNYFHATLSHSQSPLMHSMIPCYRINTGKI